MKLDIYYDSETDTLSLWNGRPATEGADVAENLVADFDDDGEVVGFTLDHASELLASILNAPPKRTASKDPASWMTKGLITPVPTNTDKERTHP